MVGIFDPDLGVFGALVDDHVDEQSATGPRAATGAVDLLRFDQSPLAAWSPIFIKLVVGIFGMLARMPLPVGIVHPDGVGGFVILLLQSIKKMAHDAFLGPISKPPA